MQDLAHRVSQALVELEALRGEKEDLELEIKRLQDKHTELDHKIESQRKLTTELLAQVHKAILGEEIKLGGPDQDSELAPPPPRTNSDSNRDHDRPRRHH